MDQIPQEASMESKELLLWERLWCMCAKVDLDQKFVPYGFERWNALVERMILVNVDVALFIEDACFDFWVCVARDGSGHLNEAWMCLKLDWNWLMLRQCE